MMTIYYTMYIYVYYVNTIELEQLTPCMVWKACKVWEVMIPIVFTQWIRRHRHQNKCPVDQASISLSPWVSSSTASCSRTLIPPLTLICLSGTRQFWATSCRGTHTNEIKVIILMIPCKEWIVSVCPTLSLANLGQTWLILGAKCNERFVLM